MHNFKELKVWQKSIDLTEFVYKFTSSFPKPEVYGITSQIRRAAISIPSNIAEGSGRNGDKEFIHFLAIAIGSAYETETQIIIAKRLNYLDESDFEQAINLLSEIQRMLNAFSQKLKNKTT